MWIIGLPIVLGLALIALIYVGFEVWMFIDAIRNPKLSDVERLLWCLGMFFIHPVVAIVYFFVARSGLNKSATKG